MCVQESICEPPRPYEAAVTRLRRAWPAILMLSLLAAAPAILVVLAGYSVSRVGPPTDEELTARFWSHQADFQALVTLLESDRRRLPLGPKSFDLADLVAAGASTAAATNYEAVLARIGAGSFRYFPGSGNVVLPVAESAEHFGNSTKSYLYSSHDNPQPLLYHRSYGWRGPGVYLISGDRRITRQWFIRHDGTVVVAFAPY
jgi:hypothetical protein